MAALIVGATSSMAMAQSDPLRFDPENFTRQTLFMPDGEEVTYKAYEGLQYVKNVEDSTYQTLNIYVPEHLADIPRVPILMRTYVGGYMASTAKW